MKPNPRGRPFRSGTPRLPRAERRESLLQAATACFVESGYDATSMDAIAERGGVSKPVLYQHFDSKHELFMEILMAAVNELQKRVKSVLDAGHEPRERVRSVVEAYYAYLEDHPDGSALLYSSATASDPTILGVIKQLNRSLADEFASSITKSSPIGDAAAHLLGCGLAGLLTTSGEHWFMQPDDIDRQQAIEHIAGVAWSGMQYFPSSETDAPVE